MQHEQHPGEEPSRRLRALEGPYSADGFSDLAFQRAREALENAVQEAQALRVQAREEARQLREDELTALKEALRGLRASAEQQIAARRRAAEAEERLILDRAAALARDIIAEAERQAATVRAEAASIRDGADQRAGEVARLEQEFDAAAAALLKRLGVDGSQIKKARLRRERK